MKVDVRERLIRPATCIARPIVDRATTPRSGRVLSNTGKAAYVAVDDFVICVSRRGVPRLPSSIEIRGSIPPAFTAGGVVHLAAGRLATNTLIIRWSVRAPIWEPKVVTVPADRPTIAKRGIRIMEGLGHATTDTARVGEQIHRLTGDLDAAVCAPARELLAAVVDDAPARLSRAARDLMGRGPGLTPEGDDVLTAILGTLVVAGRAVGVHPSTLSTWTEALVPDDARVRTSALAATLLELAAEGALAEPVHPLLDLSGDVGVRQSDFGLRDLVGIGRSTGRAYAIGVAATLLALGRHRA